MNRGAKKLSASWLWTPFFHLVSFLFSPFRSLHFLFVWLLDFILLGTRFPTYTQFAGPLKWLRQSRAPQEVVAISLPILRLLLKFIYTGMADKELRFEQIELMLEAANFYGVHNMKEQCEGGLIRSLNTSNFVDNLILADTFNASNLRRMAKQDGQEAGMANWRSRLEDEVQGKRRSSYGSDGGAC